MFFRSSGCCYDTMFPFWKFLKCGKVQGIPFPRTQIEFMMFTWYRPCVVKSSCLLCTYWYYRNALVVYISITFYFNQLIVKRFFFSISPAQLLAESYSWTYLTRLQNSERNKFFQLAYLADGAYVRIIYLPSSNLIRTCISGILEVYQTCSLRENWASLHSRLSLKRVKH